MPNEIPELFPKPQINPVASEVAALTAVVRPILRGTLYALKEEAARDGGGRDNSFANWRVFIVKAMAIAEYALNMLFMMRCFVVTVM